MSTADHKEQRGDGEDGIGAGGEKGDPGTADAFLIRCGHKPQHFFLVWPHDKPEIQYHDGPCPDADPDHSRMSRQSQGVEQHIAVPEHVDAGDEYNQ